MTLIGSAIKAAGNIGNDLTARAMLQTGRFSENLQDACFDRGLFSQILERADKHPLKPVIIPRGNVPERTHGFIAEAVHLPKIVHKIADSAKSNITGTGIVADNFFNNTVNYIDHWNHSVGQVASFVAQVGQTIL